MQGNPSGDDNRRSRSCVAPSNSPGSSPPGISSFSPVSNPASADISPNASGPVHPADHPAQGIATPARQPATSARSAIQAVNLTGSGNSTSRSRCYVLHLCRSCTDANDHGTARGVRPAHPAVGQHLLSDARSLPPGLSRC